jgi:glutaminyl-tRNA synthetase
MLEPALAKLADGDAVQFERLGYFCLDSVDAPAINRIVTLRDSWAKIEKQAMS